MNDLGFSHGLKSGGVLTAEAIGSYAMARAYVRDLIAYQASMRILLLAVLLLPCVTLPEAMLQHRFLQVADMEILLNAVNSTRFGMLRPEGPFEHPILYGLFCSSALAPLLLSQISRLKKYFLVTGMVLATLISLSSAPVLSLVVQLIAVSWNRMARGIKRRWSLLALICFLAVVAIELFSKNGAVNVLVRYATFNPQTGYMRSMQWQYGTQTVIAFPYFGVGLSDWIHPDYVPPSIDSFWLCTAVRYGLPCVLSLLAALALNIRRAALLAPAGDVDTRIGWIIAMCSVSLVAITVHLWGGVFNFFCFLLGMGLWRVGVQNQPRGIKIRSE